IGYTDAGGVPQTRVLSRAEVEALGTTPQSIVTQYGELVLNGYSQAADGTLTLSYDYTLQQAPDVDAVDVMDSFGITALDRDGDSNSQTLNIKIVDDVPSAADDSNGLTEDDVAPATGNVLGSAGASAGDQQDVPGADGATVTAVVHGVTAGTVGNGLAGDYGTLTLNPDGTYSYVLDNSNLDVQGLMDTETLTETYTYTITDGDGDTDTADLVITISGSDDGVTVTVPNDTTATTPDGDITDHVVFESGLPAGSDPDADELQVESSFTVVALDGLDATTALSIGYTDAGGVPQTRVLSRAEVEALGTTPQSIVTQYGELVLNGYSQAADGTLTLSYDYTLQQAPDVDAVDVMDSFGITALDRDGDSNSQTLNIKIVDDVPSAADDSNSVTEGATLTVGVASGVLD